MLTKIIIKNFKRFGEVEIPLDNGLVFVGPNNSGKTSVLQALALWHLGARRISANPERQTALSVNRRDLVHLPVRFLSLLWRNRNIRKGPKYIPMEITVHGERGGRAWKYGVQFTYSSNEVLFCKQSDNNADGDEYPAINVALLSAMSGLAQVEPKIEPGRINVLMGEGQTAQVLRNTCYNLMESKRDKWDQLRGKIAGLFGAQLCDPEYDVARGEIYMGYYREGGKNRKADVLDLQSAGRGFQQTILLLAFLYGNEADVLLMDEPDAHLEILRQRQVYKTIRDEAENEGKQIIAASHSEILLNESAQADKAVYFPFAGAPHIISRPGQAMKALAHIGFEYYLAAQNYGWMLYLESPSDWQILSRVARKLSHKAAAHLESPPIKYLGINLPENARNHFNGLREAVPHLTGVMLIDRVDKTLERNNPLLEAMWQKREIENYICTRNTLMNYAESHALPDNDREYKLSKNMFDGEFYRNKMAEEIARTEDALKQLDRPGLFSDGGKTSENIAPLMEKFAKSARISPLRKKDFYKLVEYMSADEIAPEVGEKLDAILAVADKAKSGKTDE